MADEFRPNLAVIGKAENHDKQAVDIVTGRLDYASDHLSGKKLITRILPSPHAHAIIVSIDASKALALDGVEAVTTYEDCPVFKKEIGYRGQEVAAVAAVDEATAAYATQLIDVEYEVLPHVVDPDEAAEAGAPLVGTYPESNVSPAGELLRGDIEAGFAEADVTIEQSVGWSSYFQHGPLDSCSAVVYWTGDQVYVWITSQNPFSQRNQLSGTLGLPLANIHLISHGTGQGFGDKHSSEWATVAAVLAKKAGKPVQFAMSRAENFLNRQHIYPVKGTITVGVKNDGTMTAIDANFHDHGGWNQSYTPIKITYKCPNARFTNDSVVTNTPPMGPWRCVWDPQANFVMDIVLDKVAEELGMNPLDFRLKNIVTPDMPDQDSGKPLSSNSIREVLETLRDAIGWEQKWHAPGTKTLPDGKMHGIAIRAHISSFGSLSSPVGAIVNVNRDGTALIDVGTSRAGGGTSSALCSIVAETLGMNYEDVNVGDWGNTDVMADGGGQGGSTRVITLGAAFQMAALEARAKLFETAATMLDVSVDELEAEGGKIFEKANPSNSKTIGEVSARTRGPVIGTGITWNSELRKPVAGFDIGEPCEVRTMVGAAVEVAVDTETGEVEILNLIGADDMGRAIFRKGCENQIEGGLEIQVGEALLYEQIIDKGNGATLNTSYVDNKWPTTLDLHTDRHRAIIVESIDAVGAYGCKGLGEPPVCSNVVIVQAVYNAIGVWVPEQPIYPQDILKALGKA